MSVTGVFARGRGIGHESAVSVLRYVPRPRVPWQPSRFGRANLTAEDLAQLWGRGRYRDGPGNYNSGYSSERTHVLEDNTVALIPKHELEKYMPDIGVGPKALVTPVSLMSARHGHRVTHDMLHSYDPHVGRLAQPAVVNHDDIRVEDPNRVGLNAATLDCRGRIYRWLRRGPFFMEDHYFRRSLRLSRDGGGVPAAVHEAPLMKRVIRLARRGNLKAACEEYRRITSVPPVEVYRALTACCVAPGRIADAVAIFEDGDARLLYVARDGEVLHNLMRCAIRARHRVRVMWVYNVMRGRFYENVVVRAEIDSVWRFRIAHLALEFLLDGGCAEEAAAVYRFLDEDCLLRCDVDARAGVQMREALAAGRPVSRATLEGGSALERDVVAVAPEVAREVYRRHLSAVGGGPASGASAWAAMDEPAAGLSPDEALAWLQRHFDDVRVASVMRWARFCHARDLMARDRPRYLGRAAEWITLLSARGRTLREAPLAYMRKSRPLALATNPNVRVAWVARGGGGGGCEGPRRLLAREEGFTFHYDGAQTRLVRESHRHPGESLQSRCLALQPIHSEVSAADEFRCTRTPQGRLAVALAATASGLHDSVTRELRGDGARGLDGRAAAAAATGVRPSAAAGGGSGGATPEF